MEKRRLGSTGYHVSMIGFGGWAIGGAWGDVPEEDALAALRTALDEGVTFLDTADVYGDGRSERLIARVLNELPPKERARITVATKVGRRLDPHVPEGYVYENLAGFVDRSRDELRVDTLDLVQLHCPPTEVYRRDDAFEAMERMVREGRVRHVGVSVETVEEALLAVERPVVETVQIIFNPFRLRPAEEVFPAARAHDVGIVVRVPLASGLLTGKFDEDATFAASDHRHFNRHGDAFDVGETFSGVDFDTGVAAARELGQVVPEGATLAQVTLRWILMNPDVSTVIPGAKRPAQARENARAAELPPLNRDAMETVRRVYDERIRPQVHHRW
ncbi:MAG: aldo/keto reductase [Trueperaceae bacterium]|nr:aldo/keto reductase [Trueperaceae bacterium]